MHLLQLLGPPCIGAFIGYLTNRIAIRMLFRPLAPWHICGVRVPLTPGIIPAKRHALARNIGEMVGRKLLTSEELGRAIAAASFQERLLGLIARQVDVFCKTQWPPLAELAPGDDAVLRDALAEPLAAGVNAWLAAPEAERELALWLAYVGANADAALFRPLVKQLLIGAFGGEGQDGPRLGPAIGALLAARLRQAAAEGKRLRDLLPAALPPHLHAVLDEQSPGIWSRVARGFLAPEARPDLLAALTALARHLLDSLGPVGAVAAGFFEPDTFAKKIDEYLDAHGAEVEQWLSGPAIREQLAKVLRDGLEALLDRDVAGLLSGLPPGRLAEVCGAVGKQAASALRGEAALTRLADALAASLPAALRAEPDGAEQSTDTKSAAVLLRLLRSPQGQACIRAASGALLRRLLERPFRLPARIPPSLRARLTERLTRHANELLVRELPTLAPALGIQELVCAKVDSLDLLQLERLLLDIMAEQFKYINLFGALLGFLIGLANLCLLL